MALVLIKIEAMETFTGPKRELEIPALEEQLWDGQQ